MKLSIHVVIFMHYRMGATNSTQAALVMADEPATGHGQSGKAPMETGSRITRVPLTKVRSQRAPGYNEQISLHQNN